MKSRNTKTISSPNVPTLIKQINFDHSKVESVKQAYNREKDSLDIDISDKYTIPETFPSVSILTVTKNRKKYFPLAINNWKRMEYPTDKLEWIIIDDSDNVNNSPETLIKALNDHRITYIHLTTSATIGYKRNLSVKTAKYDYLCNMDDDDFFFKESIYIRVASMREHEKECIYSDSIGIYNIIHENSYIVEQYKDVPESTMMFTRSFWEKCKFNEQRNECESIDMINGRECEMLKIPYYFTVILLNHKSNHTGRLRRVNIKTAKRMLSVVNNLNFYKLSFPNEFKEIIKNITKIT